MYLYKKGPYHTEYGQMTDAVVGTESSVNQLSTCMHGMFM
jgi:hypothetical protein